MSKKFDRKQLTQNLQNHFYYTVPTDTVKIVEFAEQFNLAAIIKVDELVYAYHSQVLAHMYAGLAKEIITNFINSCNFVNFENVVTRFVNLYCDKNLTEEQISSGKINSVNLNQFRKFLDEIKKVLLLTIVLSTLM